MDELRDCRFFEDDLIHVNSSAVNYIWKKFTEARMSAETCQLLKEIDAILKATNHRTVNPKSKSQHTFLRALVIKTKKLQAQNPDLNFEKEIEFFSK